MHQKSKRICFAALAAAGLILAASPAQAGHVYGGLIDTNGTPGLQAGDALSFVDNSTGAVATGPSLGIQTMSLVPPGFRAGLYLTSGISWTALSNGLNWTGSAYRTANAFAATTGSLLQLQIVSISGLPNGAEFSLWDLGPTNPGSDLDEPIDTYTVGSGITHGDGFMNLTDLTLLVGDGINDASGEPPATTNNPAVDPYGHMHSRSITVDTVGDFTVTYLLHDANGIHPDSAPFVVSYSAVPEPSSIALISGCGLALGLIRRCRS